MAFCGDAGLCWILGTNTNVHAIDIQNPPMYPCFGEILAYPMIDRCIDAVNSETPIGETI